MKTARVRVETPEGRSELALTAAEAAAPLTEILARRGLPLNTRCGGRGVCAGCEVTWRDTAGGERRVKACQTRLPAGGEVELVVPARSLLRHEPAVVSEFRVGVPWAKDPLEPGARYGVAVDAGTTTVALLLCDLAEGRVVAEASAFNAQIRHGEDVLTRIQHCATGAAAVAELRRAIAEETIQPLLERAAEEAGIAPREIGAMTVAGNTTMLHLLAGVDPTPMGTHPFAPVFLEHRTLAPREIGLTFGGGGGAVHLLPGPAAYVGADIAAGLVATGMAYEEGPALLVDAGTNGEIVVKAGERLVGCATAAGPAFEGAGLSCGVRGVKGAIERVRLRAGPFGVETGVIGGGERPIGLCGSAYVDFLWEARRAGIVGTNGRFTAEFLGEAGDAVAADRWGKKLRVHPRGAAGPIWVSEADVARLLQAKAAIAAGVGALLRAVGVEPGGVRTVHLAGGFGMHLSLEHAIGCGLLPGFTERQVSVAGNASLAGAFLALNDRGLLEEMKAVCRRMETIELNLQPGFEDAYIDNLTL